MITAVDTNILLDVFGADPTHGVRSRAALRRALSEGGLIACEVVFAEVAASFPSAVSAAEAMDGLDVAFSPLDRAAALTAGEAWKAYRGRGGRKERVIADFLIGAHALASADRLLTRDRGYYRTGFRRLRLIDPAAG